MSDTLAGTAGGIWALLAWSTSDWLLSRNSKKYNPHQINFLIQIPGLFITLTVMLLSGRDWPGLGHALIIMSAGLVFTIAYLAFIKALSIGSVGIVVPLSSVFPLVTLILTLIFLSTALSALQIAAMLVIVGGVVILGFEKRQKNIPLRIQHLASMLALSAAILWGFGNFVQNIVVDEEPWQVMMVFINIAMAITATLMLLFLDKQNLSSKLEKIKNNRIGWIAGSLLTLGSFGFYIGASKLGNVLIPLVIASAAPLVVSLLSVVFDKERLTVIKRLGAVIVVTGIIVLNLG